MNQMIELLHKQAAEIARAGHNGWGNTMTDAAAEIERLVRTLHEIAEECAGAECGEPVHAQEAYAIGLAKRMYSLAVEGLKPNV